MSDLYNSIYSILVKHAGAPECDRFQFVDRHDSENPPNEWRFQGKLGFGGKYWPSQNIVTYYPEDETEERKQIKRVTDTALHQLDHLIKPKPQPTRNHE